MPRRLPPHVERNRVKNKNYYSFRIGKGPRIRLPDDPTSEEFRTAYAAAMVGEPRLHSITGDVEKGIHDTTGGDEDRSRTAIRFWP